MSFILRPLLGASLTLASAAPVLAFDRVLPSARIKDNGDIQLSDDVKLGKRQGGKTILQPDSLQIGGEGSTGPASGLGVSPKAGGTLSSLRKLFMSGCPPIEAFGGKADGATDNTAAYLRALSPAEGRLESGAVDRGACVAFGSGEYLFSSPVSYTYPSSGTYPNRAAHAVALRGAGSAATSLKFASSAGLQFVLDGYKQTLHLSGMSIVTTSTGGGSGVKVTQNECMLSFDQSTFSDLTFRGERSDLNHRWDIDAEIIGMSGTSWKGVTFYGDDTWSHGTGLSFKGNMSGSRGCTQPFIHSIYHNLDHVIFNQHDTGLLLDDYVQGITITGANFQNGNYGIRQPAGMLAPDNVQFNITNSQFQLGVADISIGTGFALSSISNSLFLMGENPGVVGIDLRGTNLFTISGNVFNTVVPGTGGGIGVRTNGAVNTIVGNSFSGLTTGVDLMAGSQNNTVTGNTYNVMPVPYINAGTNNTLPVVPSSTTVAITSCDPATYFVPHKLPAAPKTDRIQASVSQPATGGANIATPNVWVRGTDATNVTVSFSCGTFGASGNIQVNLTSSLSN